jgi:archaellum component FlaF (FlaF/FlaG flagellin family)
MGFLNLLTTFGNWIIGDGFILIITILFTIIMVVFANRLNNLDEAINTLNSRLDNLSTTLVAISNRPCQLETHGFEVEIKDPTGRKLDKIKKEQTSN